MEIYIGNLPGHVNSDELKKVVNSVLLPSSFRELMRRMVHKNERIRFSSFDVMENQEGNSDQRFAHAVIMPDKVARQLLSRMNHLSYQGKSLRVREYATRRETNDRRHGKSHNLYSVGIYNRRLKERRLPLGQ